MNANRHPRCLLTTACAVVALTITAQPAHSTPASGNPPDFAHPESPHYRYHSVANGGNTRPLLVLYQSFDEYPLPAGQGAGWMERRFFGGFPAVADYYRANSFGRIDFEPARETDGVADDGVVTLDAGAAGDFFIERPEGISNEEWRGRVLANEYRQNRRAVERADEAVDFSRFDRNGDRRITTDELVLVHMQVSRPGAGDFLAAARGIDAGPTLDGVSLDEMPVAMAASDTNLMTLVHEVMHTGLGLDRDWYQYPIAGFDVMGGTIAPPGRPDRLVGVSAWNKMHLGWVRPTVVSRDGYRVLGRADRHPDAVLLHDPGKASNPTEHYLLVENRRKGTAGSYDRDVTDSGLVVWRVDETRYYENEASAQPIWVERPCWDRPECPPDWADDVWDPSTPNTPQRTISVPWNDGTPSRVAIRAISAAGDSMRAYFDVPGPGILVDAATERGEVRTVDVTPGESNRVDFTAMNTSDGRAIATFGATRMPAGWTTGGGSVRHMADHEEQTVTALVTPPADAPTTTVDAQVWGDLSYDVYSESPVRFRVVLDETQVATPDASAIAGELVTLRATVTNPDDPGAPALAGVPVDFELNGEHTTATTGPDGVATVEVRAPNEPGEHRFSARTERSGKHARGAGYATLTVAARPVTLTYDVARSGQYSDPVRFDALLRDRLTGAPIADAGVLFAIGADHVFARTGDDGRASGSVILRAAAREATALAYFGGDRNYARGRPEAVPFTIEHERLTLQYTGDTAALTGGTVTAAIRATQEDDGYPGDLSLAQIRFDAAPTLSGGDVRTLTSPVTAEGAAEAAFELPVDLWRLQATVPDTSAHWRAASPATAEVAVQDPGRVLRGGAVARDNGGRTLRLTLGPIEFAGGAWTGETRLDTPEGAFRGASHEWVIAGGRRAIIRVTGTLGRDTPAVLHATITDSGSSVRDGDTFTARLTSPTGTTLYDAGEITGSGGNLQVD